MPRPIQLSIPYNQDLDLIKKIIKYKDYIHSLYLPSHPKIMGSGRSSFLCIKGGKKPKYFNLDTTYYNEEIDWIINKLKQNKIKTFLLLNALWDGLKYTSPNNIGKLINYIASFENLYGVVVTNLFYARAIKEELPHIKIKASLNADIDSITRALYWKDFCGIDYITISEDINKNLELIKKIKEATQAKIEVIVNNPCLPLCPLRIQHQNYESHVDLLFRAQETFRGYPLKDLCLKIQMNTRPEILLNNNYITPYNLRYYKDMVDVFKIAGRDRTTNFILNEIKRYVEGKSTYSEFLHTNEPPEIFKQITKCDRKCTNCNWCKDIYERLIKNQRVENIPKER